LLVIFRRLENHKTLAVNSSRQKKSALLTLMYSLKVHYLLSGPKRKAAALNPVRSSFNWGNRWLSFAHKNLYDHILLYTESLYISLFMDAFFFPRTKLNKVVSGSFIWGLHSVQWFMLPS